MPVRLNINIEVFEHHNTGAVGDFLAQLLKDAQTQGGTVSIRAPDTVPADDPPAAEDPLLGPTPAQTAPPSPPKDTRVRDRAAERARTAAKQAAQPAAPPAAEPDPLLGEAPNGHGDPFENDPIPAAEPEAPSMKARQPSEYMDSAIVILRQCYGVPGGSEQVKVIQKEFQVSQFTKVPLEKAGALYNRALALAQTLSVKLPPGV